MRRFQQDTGLPFPAARVIELITSDDYLDFRYGDSAVIASEITLLEDDDDQFAYRVMREAPTQRLPGFVRRMLGGRIRFTQEHRWFRHGPPYRGELEIGVDGFEGEIRAQLELAPESEDDTRFSAAGHIHARIPLVGGRIESLLLSGIDRNFEESRAHIVSWLEQNA